MLKETDKMSRLVREFEKAFIVINADLFDGKLPSVIITIVPSIKSYVHYARSGMWNTEGGIKREINISSGALNKPFIEIISSMIHEMTHMWNEIVLREQDVSGSSGAYHNKIFKREAEKRGLIVTRDDKYGWAITKASDDLVRWLWRQDELNKINMERFSQSLSTPIKYGTRCKSRIVKPNNAHHRRYVCPQCGTVIRATKKISIMCVCCKKLFIET